MNKPTYPRDATEPGADYSSLLTETELAKRWRISVKTLQNWRVTGGGVPFVKCPGFVRYRLADILIWEQAHTRRSTSEGGDRE